MASQIKEKRKVGHINDEPKPIIT